MVVRLFDNHERSVPTIPVRYTPRQKRIRNPRRLLKAPSPLSVLLSDDIIKVSDTFDLLLPAELSDATTDERAKEEMKKRNGQPPNSNAPPDYQTDPRQQWSMQMISCIEFRPVVNLGLKVYPQRYNAGVEYGRGNTPLGQCLLSPWVMSIGLKGFGYLH